MANGWTPERRERMARQIHSWKPWERSTGPRTAEGKARVARNAWKGGVRPAARRLAKTLNDERTPQPEKSPAQPESSANAYAC